MLNPWVEMKEEPNLCSHFDWSYIMVSPHSFLAQEGRGFLCRTPFFEPYPREHDGLMEIVTTDRNSCVGVCRLKRGRRQSAFSRYARIAMIRAAAMRSAISPTR